ncbi:MAG: hypothetical protein ABSF88_09670 [Candidatus Aminicenantales bacterium]
MKDIPKAPPSKLYHWKKLIETLEKIDPIAAVTSITMEPIYPPTVRGGKKYIHAASVEFSTGIPLFKDFPNIRYSARLCLEHQDECWWDIVACPNIKI